MTLKVDQDCAIGVSFTEGEVVYAQHPHFLEVSFGGEVLRPRKQRVAPYEQTQLDGESGACPTAEFQNDRQ